MLYSFIRYCTNSTVLFNVSAVKYQSVSFAFNDLLFVLLLHTSMFITLLFVAFPYKVADNDVVGAYLPPPTPHV